MLSKVPNSLQCLETLNGISALCLRDHLTQLSRQKSTKMQKIAINEERHLVLRTETRRQTSIKKVFNVYVLSACMYVYHVCAWCSGDQKRGSDPLELEIQMVVSHFVAARNQSKVHFVSS